MSKPTSIILGGPNGSGKSSAYAKLQLDGAWINADEIAKELTGSSDGRAAAMAAGRRPSPRSWRLSSADTVVQIAA